MVTSYQQLALVCFLLSKVLYSLVFSATISKKKRPYGAAVKKLLLSGDFGEDCDDVKLQLVLAEVNNSGI